MLDVVLSLPSFSSSHAAGVVCVEVLQVVVRACVSYLLCLVNDGVGNGQDLAASMVSKEGEGRGDRPC